MKISKFFVPILGLPLVLGTGLTTLVSCKDKNDSVNAFENDSWTTIVFFANRGLDALKNHYGLDSFVGLERTVKIYGVEHKVRVVGENEDYLADNEGKPDITKPVALTFQFANIVSGLNDEGTIMPLPLPFDTTTYLFSYWGGSAVRKFLRGEGYYKDYSFYDELKQQLGNNAIKEVVKYSMLMNDLAKPGIETLFLPGITDIFNVEQTYEYVDEDFIGEATLVEGEEIQYHEPYSYYRNAIDQDDEQAPRNRQRVLALTDADGFYEPYWLRTSCVNEIGTEEDPTKTLSISADGKWNRTTSATQLHIAPIFCI